MGLFKKIANALKKTKEAISRKFDALLSGGELNDEFYEELEDVLISSDVGAKASIEIVDELRVYARKNKIRTANDVRAALKEILISIFDDVKVEKYDGSFFKVPAIVSVIGVNGVGKTTSLGKLAHNLKKEGKEVCLVAADTFRAAAAEQLTMWANRAKVRIIKHAEGADAGAVVYDGIASAKAKKTDVLLVDTAGRLHTKENLMNELAKIDRIIDKEYPEANRYNLIVIDATTGQNAVSQIENFNEFVKLDGIILTKLDGTAKGGIIISIAKTLKLPVFYVGVGEGIDDLEEFNAKEFVENIF
ncbi:MAG: signal recognition particle-docking protein FtsY [Firmicutes bacterium]|nr:signal recognition particle-docking protein FtsY [Bacillota bacterium]MDY5585992.1 signal recognition particle-docking protein FtsY [Eubacteriales bacterium]